MKLKETFLRGLKASGRAQKHTDGGGLYLFVSLAGGKLWRMDYRFEGKRKTLSLGAYPIVGLRDARQRRDDARRQLSNGIDPGAHKQAAKAATKGKAENSFEVVAREWLAIQKKSCTESYRAIILSRLEKDIFPKVGARPIGDIDPHSELLPALRKIEARGTLVTARRNYQYCSQVYRYGVATGRAKRDITADLRGALATAKEKSFASIKEPKAIGALLRDIEAYEGNLIVRFALRMAPYVFVRPGELRKAEWAELNFAGAEWRIPAEKMKMRQVHIVPLARQVLAILEGLRQYTGSGRLLFPSMRANSSPISNMTLLAGLRRLGYDKETMTVHGFRSMASTRLNEAGFNRDWIERQLAHGEQDSVRRAYNYAEYLKERRTMMQWWADYLDELRASRS